MDLHTALGAPLGSPGRPLHPRPRGRRLAPPWLGPCGRVSAGGASAPPWSSGIYFMSSIPST
eukprot:12047024-Alexandrium_andersonii.AAC.1